MPSGKSLARAKNTADVNPKRSQSLFGVRILDTDYATRQALAVLGQDIKGGN